MEIGIVGKPNVGKSTFFTSATMTTAEIANYPFTTVKPNRGVATVRSPCPCKELGVECNPRNSQCLDGTRLIPVELIDVAGLVPGASQGRGMGNQFLSDLTMAEALVHVVDATGSTDAEGNPCSAGERDPEDDIRFLEDEMSLWMKGLMTKDWGRLSRQIELDGKKLERSLAEKFAGLGIAEHQISRALRKSQLGGKPSQWSEDDLLSLARYLRESGKPIIVAANKSDAAPPEIMDRLTSRDGRVVIPTSAEVELALRRAAKSGLVQYLPGGSSFELVQPDRLSPAQRQGMEKIRTFLKQAKNTGVQQCLDKIIFEVMDRIVVYPVVDDTHYTDNDGRVLPDAFLMSRGSTARDLAYRVHTDFGDHFIRAIDARTKRVIGADHELQDHDVIRIITDA